MTDIYICSVCWSEKIGNTCLVCTQRQREEEQQAKSRVKLTKWEEEHPISFPLETILPERWDSYGRPDYEDRFFRGPQRWNVAARCINELYNMIEDLKFELAEKEAENDHRCCQCGSPEGRQGP